MKREEELVKQLTEMAKDTKAGKVHWNVICQTTEYNDADSKPTLEEDGIHYTVDECYVSYHCEYKGKESINYTKNDNSVIKIIGDDENPSNEGKEVIVPTPATTVAPDTSKNPEDTKELVDNVVKNAEEKASKETKENKKEEKNAPTPNSNPVTKSAPIPMAVPESLR